MIVECTHSGKRIDAHLSELLPDFTRSAAQKLVEDGCVTCGGKVVSKGTRTVEGQLLEVNLPQLQETAIVPVPMELDVRFEDDDIIVINKPKGLVVHPAVGHWDDTLVNGLLHHCKDSLSGINGEIRPGIVHRIDKDTSGLLIVAKNDFAHQALAAQLADHTLSRTYQCIVRGGIKEECGTIDAPIGRNPKDRKKMCVTPNNSRIAITHWKVLEHMGQYTHLQCNLETGRTHQIRVHLAYEHRPIVGDVIYGVQKPEFGQKSQCLHASQLDFIHPRTKMLTTVTCPLPEYFTQLLEKLRLLQSRP